LEEALRREINLGGGGHWSWRSYIPQFTAMAWKLWGWSSPSRFPPGTEWSWDEN